jgi:hypothetical protein
MANSKKKEEIKKDLKKGDKVCWVSRVNGVDRKYHGTVLLKVNKNMDAEKVIKKINKKLHVSEIFNLTARHKARRDQDSYIIEVINSEGASVLYWPLSRKLYLDI